ncbi:MAG: hypothetical protein M0D53_14140 [Flavobacterium sp. JAD_PAG50586_2]|nr:MAG: hypothetical protein M0D53_14140 [Flavobacterium sp. JAD_PAG50586_2]
MTTDQKIYNTSYLSFVLLGLGVFGFALILIQLLFFQSIPDNFGVVGDALGGILNPIVGIAATLVTFLAFYMQKKANDIIQEQFNKNMASEHIDFVFNNYKSRLLMIINEINNFNISFHGNKLISKIEYLDDKNDKKYNFIGIQGINLFLVEFLEIKKSKKTKEQKLI